MTEEARTLMVDGNAQLHAGKPSEALEKLERSFALVASPNTELLVARALRDLGRKVEAATRFEHAEAEARRRALAGEVKYGQTEAAAHTEGASLRSQLATLRVHVARPAKAILLVDGKPVALAAEGDTAILHEPGRAEVVVREDEAEQKQVLTLVAGTTIQMEFAGKGAPPVAPREVAAKPIEGPPPPKKNGASWAVPAALISGGVTLVGAGGFAFFGLESRSTYDDLANRCGPSFCGSSRDRADADRGKSQQTIANVSLAVGAVAAVATVAFVVIRLTSTGESTSSASAKLRRIEPIWSFTGL